MPDQMLGESQVLDAIQELAQAVRDSEEGYRMALKDSGEGDLSSMFAELAQARARQAGELEEVVRRMGGQMPQRSSGTLGGAAHRMLTGLKAALLRSDRLAALEVMARSEAHAEACYDRALRRELTPDIRPEIERQHREIRDSRDRLRGMRQRERDETFTRWSDTLSQGGQRSIKAVNQYVTERPVTSTLVALGAGFLLGILVSAPLLRGSSDRS